MFSAKVFTIMIGSLSGTMEEVYVAKEVVRKWNQLNAESTRKLFMPVEWTGNPDELQKVDVVIGLVGNYIDNQVFIEDCLKAGKKVTLFFNAYQDPKNTIQSEHDEVNAFKRSVEANCCCIEYRGSTNLAQLLVEKLWP